MGDSRDLLSATATGVWHLGAPRGRGAWAGGLTLTVTMLGCCALRMVLISLSDVIGKPSFSFSI